MHNKCYPAGQNSGITPPADANDGHLPVPSQQLFPSGGLDLHTSWAAVFRRPFLFAVNRCCTFHPHVSSEIERPTLRTRSKPQRQLQIARSQTPPCLAALLTDNRWGYSRRTSQQKKWRCLAAAYRPKGAFIQEMPFLTQKLGLQRGFKRGLRPLQTGFEGKLGFSRLPLKYFSTHVHRFARFLRGKEKENKNRRLPIADRSSCRRCRSTAACAIPAACPARGICPACPAQQRCSAAVAAVRPLGGPGGVFEKNENRKGWQGAGPEPQKDTSHADHEG